MADELLVLNDSRVPPFSPAEEAIANEEVRLQYRYLDLRRPEMQQNFALRHEIAGRCGIACPARDFWRSRRRS